MVIVIGPVLKYIKRLKKALKALLLGIGKPKQVIFWEF